MQKLTFPAAWSAYWLPVFKALTTQCTNPCREVRQVAFTSLQRSLLSAESTCSDHREWTVIFSQVLFPLNIRLLKPEVFSTDRDGMSETRVQAASLLCKVFLRYLVLLSKWNATLELDLWLKIIDIMDRLMNSGQGDSLVSSSVNIQQREAANADIFLGGGRTRKPQECAAGHVERRISCSSGPGPKSREGLD